MSKSEPVDPRVRLAISRWPDDAPRGTVTAFCAEYGISRKTFYTLRHRARELGPAAVLEPLSRRPHHSPSRIPEQVKDQAIEVRAVLESSGLDHGPISVFDRMQHMGLEPPSIATLARIFRERDVARQQPNKRPRAAYRRFVYPAPNACWQLDATEYVLTRGRTCVIFQLIDDHSRLAVATHVAHTENAADAVITFDKAVTAYGVPQRLLTDNHAAINPSRRGMIGPLVARAISLGVDAITGKPYKPSTQGKNERFHSTLFRWLNKQPIAESLAQLQALVDEFDVIYNTRRPHQGLPGRITPQQAYDAIPVAEPPRPPAVPAPIEQPPAPGEELTPTESRARKHERVRNSPTGQQHRKVTVSGTVVVRGHRFYLSNKRAGQTVLVAWDEQGIAIADIEGAVLATHPWPAPGTYYVPRQTFPPQETKTTTKTESKPMSPMS